MQKVLFHYRLLPHQESGKSPAELMFGRNLNSRLNLIFPRTEQKIKSEDVISSKIKQFEIGERVAVCEYLDKNIKWRFGIVIEKLGKLHYRVQLRDNRIWKRHVNQMRAVGSTAANDTQMKVLDYGSPIINANSDSNNPSKLREQSSMLSGREKPLKISSEHPEQRELQVIPVNVEQEEAPDQIHPGVSPAVKVPPTSVANQERSVRKRKPPDRFGNYWSH